MKSLTTAFLGALLMTVVHTAYGKSHYYDDVGRLTQVAYDSGSGIAYTYDENDNLLTSKTIFLPQKPPPLTATITRDSGITLQWTAVSGSTTYRIYRRSSQNLNWDPIAEVSSTTFAFFDTTVQKDTRYHYRLVSVGSQGLSAYSQSTAEIDVNGVTASIAQYSESLHQPIYSIRFFAEEEGLYRLDSNTGLEVSSSWTSQEYSLAPNGSLQIENLTNLSGWITLYVTLDDSSHPKFFRLIRVFQ